jgi:hypothetical protein
VSAARQIAPPPGTTPGELRAVPGALRCKVVPSDANSEEKTIDLLRWLLSIDRERKAQAVR